MAWSQPLGIQHVRRHHAHVSPRDCVTRSNSYLWREVGSQLHTVHMLLSLSSPKTRLAGLGCPPGNVSGRLRACASRAHHVRGAASRGLLCRRVPWPSGPVPTTRDRTLRPVRHHSPPEVSTSRKAKAWHLSPPAACSWAPTTATGTTRVPLPVTGPVEVPSPLGKPSPTPTQG